MSEVLSVAEIHQRYPAEWVLLGDPQKHETQGVQGGTLLCHSKDRDEVYRVAIGTPFKRIAVFHTGKLLLGTAILI